jgi:hypothetical protein
MDSALRRILIFLVGALVGYCSGFKDAQVHEDMVFVRVVQRVQAFGERTIGERGRQIEEAAKEVTGENDR